MYRGMYACTLRRFKPLGIARKVNASGEICKVCIFLLILFFPDFYAIYDICQLPSVEPRVLTNNLRHFVYHFQALKGPLKGRRGSPTTLHGQTIVP